MNALLLCFGFGWIGLMIVFETAQLWNILRAAGPLQDGWTRVNEVFGSYNYPYTLFEAFVFVPGFVALALRRNRIAKAADRGLAHPSP